MLPPKTPASISPFVHFYKQKMTNTERECKPIHVGIIHCLRQHGLINYVIYSTVCPPSAEFSTPPTCPRSL